MFVHLPKSAVIARYSQQPSGAYAVVTPFGATLAPSFYALRDRFTFVCSVSGAGGWVVLAPISQAQPAANQPALF